MALLRSGTANGCFSLSATCTCGCACRHVVILLSVDLQIVFRGRAKYIPSPRTRTIHLIVDSKKFVSRISFWVLRDYQNQLQILPRFTETIRQHLLIEHSFGARIRGAVLLREPECLAFASLSILPSLSMAKARAVYSYICPIIFSSVISLKKNPHSDLCFLLNSFKIVTSLFLGMMFPKCLTACPGALPLCKMWAAWLVCSAHLVLVPHVSYLVGIKSILL